MNTLIGVFLLKCNVVYSFHGYFTTYRNLLQSSKYLHILCEIEIESEIVMPKLTYNILQFSNLFLL